MAIQVINCPQCNTFLLDDTPQCHSCGHILNAVEAAKTERRQLPTDAAVDDDMEVCSNCNETVRKGLVRCWNCGAFTRPEIEASFRQRLSQRAATVSETFEFEVLSTSSVSEENAFQRRNLNTPESFLATPFAVEEDSGGDDFELGEDVTLNEEEFDLGQTIHLRSEQEAGSEGYALAPRHDSEMGATIPMSVLSEPAPNETESVPSEMETIPLMPLETSQEANSDAPAPIPDLSSKGSSSEDPSGTTDKAGSQGATPEDELLRIAAAEEAEIAKVRKDQRSQDTFVVFCPQGHRIRVREKFRGKQGKCPKCESMFVVPLKMKVNAKKKTDPEMATSGSPAAGLARYSTWLTDIRMHTVVPEKLKLKADSLLNDFQSVDVGIGSSEVFVATLVSAGGMFGGAAKKKPAARAALVEYFSKSDAMPAGATAATKRVISGDALKQLVLVQPASFDTESLFGNIPVFGTNRIAVRLPKQADDKHAVYLSFCLSEFRAFSKALQESCGLEAFGSNSEIPLEETYTSAKCHYGNNVEVRDLASINYYEKDPGFKLEVSGWKCGACGIVVSEAARAKEKLGGANGKGIAKAKCPKCSQKMGNNPFRQLIEAPAPAPAATQEPAEDAKK